ncbi:MULTISPECIES: SDR family oxidoreductase [unclassified Microbacterium]|uniref:SDR family oxidoreductase n=1 Tax=unclassified Microbacterium TaxID=2609290 RepID=UPI000CFDFCA6|nr:MULTISPECIES: SDR family oxidoreductase [unclassified Microbacterium]PQZ55055.1 NAD(P)-dependent oxidoreductase [Microbacterium sp. MYb43]PQZ81500.1 NAD(P)-dependent oxidoreductase [Microbacterium sp. MYb40]PRB21482.1 NAD(P)-dependent oxidoreductase [Microbacterium sp. MYb54]PRB30047.1 NAD(P)-dependent oxidoreductase [Microbacterium sp. MYb50]PRB67795.1 NAD(P)-dependent oxidoreductase [Microbacterium sp. MYb24]
MTILVTGATGNLGRLIIASLIERGADPQSIVAGARDTTKAADLGVRVVHLDYTDPASVSAAVEGIDTVVLVSGSEVGQRVAQHQAVIEAAKAAGISKFVYTSAPKATTSDLILAPEHKATEELITAAGLPAVILRNNWYTENYAADLTRAAETGVLAAGTGEGRVASASRKDFADAAAVVALEDGHIGEVYELGGDVAWTYTDLAAAFAEVTGREVSFVPVGFEDQIAALRDAGLDEGTAGFVAALDAGIKNGALADTDGTLARLIGRPTTPLVEGLRAASA